MFDNKKALISGGLGFIGSVLPRALVKRNARVTVVHGWILQYCGNRFNISEIYNKLYVNICDVRDLHAMKYFVQGQDNLFNLAGQTSRMDSMTDSQTNLNINASHRLLILEACRPKNADIKTLFASTRQFHGKQDYLPVDGEHPSRPVNVNGFNKLASVWYHLFSINMYGARACAARV